MQQEDDEGEGGIYGAEAMIYDVGGQAEEDGMDIPSTIGNVSPVPVPHSVTVHNMHAASKLTEDGTSPTPADASWKVSLFVGERCQPQSPRYPTTHHLTAPPPRDPQNQSPSGESQASPTPADASWKDQTGGSPGQHRSPKVTTGGTSGHELVVRMVHGGQIGVVGADLWPEDTRVEDETGPKTDSWKMVQEASMGGGLAGANGKLSGVELYGGAGRTTRLLEMWMRHVKLTRPAPR